MQVSQEQQLRDQIGHIDLMLRQQQTPQTITTLNHTRAALMSKLQQLVRPNPGPQILQYPQGTPQQSLSQAMQWMPPHPSQPRAARRQVADPREVQQRAQAKLCMAAAPVPDQLGPEGAAAVQRRRGLLEAHDELERNNTWMQELLSPCDATTKQDPTESWDAIRERLAGWQVRPSHTSPPPSLGPTYCPPPVHARLPPRHRRGASSCKRSSRRSMRSCARASSRRLGVPPSTHPSLPPSPPRPGAS